MSYKKWFRLRPIEDNPQVKQRGYILIALNKQPLYFANAKECQEWLGYKNRNQVYQAAASGNPVYDKNGRKWYVDVSL